MKHIVIWKLKQENKIENAIKIKSELENLVGVVKEIKYLEVGINSNPADFAYDVCLITEFESQETLNAYQINPAHVKVAQFINTVVADKKVIDY